MTLNVIYEDNHLIAVEKPINVPVQSDISGDTDLQSMLKEYIARKYNKPGNVFLGLLHRLDRPVGGVMLFARTSKSASRVSEQIRTGRIKKQYLVVVEGKTSPSGTLTHWLVKNPATNMVTAYESEVPGSKKAILDFERQDFANGHTLLRVNLITGRSHQIRVQCASMGHPIWGDQRYNNRSVVGQQIALWANRLIFQHPVTKDELVLCIMPPTSEPWKWFKVHTE